MADAQMISSLTDLLAISQDVLKAYKHQPWWRGHAVESWALVPHVHRYYDKKGPQYERSIANKFAKFAPTRHAHCPPPGDLARWLFLMQHYGLPTRLLDWTESPLLAVYFAVWENEHMIKDGAIWALDPFALNGLTCGEAGLYQPGEPDPSRLVTLAFAPGPPTDECVVALVTEEIDYRMMVQLSGMTIHGSPRPLNERPGIGSDVLRKFVIDGRKKALLREELASLGIRQRTVFPGLEHLARDLEGDWY